MSKNIINEIYKLYDNADYSEALIRLDQVFSSLTKESVEEREMSNLYFLRAKLLWKQNLVDASFESIKSAIKSYVDIEYLNFFEKMTNLSQNYNSALTFLSDCTFDINNEFWLEKQLGWLNYCIREYDKSLLHYKKAECLNVEALDLIEKLGLTCKAIGDFELALNYLIKILDSNAISEQVQKRVSLNMAQCYSYLAQYKESIDIYEKYFSGTTNEPILEIFLKSCAGLNEPERAVAYLNKIESLDQIIALCNRTFQDNVDFYTSVLNHLSYNTNYVTSTINLELVRIFHEKGEDNKVLEYLEEMVACNREKDSFILATVGYYFTLLYHYDRALEVFEQSFKFGYKDKEWLLFNIANCCYELKEYQKSIDYIEKLDPKVIKSSLGLLMLVINNFIQLKSVDEIYSFSSKIDNIGLLFQVGNYLIEKRLSDIYLQTLDNFDAIDNRQVVQINLEKARVHRLFGNIDKSLVFLERAYEFNIDSEPFLYADTAYEYEQCQKIEDALRFYGKAIESGYIENDWINFRRGFCNLSIKNFELALEFLNKGLNLIDTWGEQNLEWIHLILGICYYEIDRCEKAIEHLTIAENLGDLSARFWIGKVYELDEKYDLAVSYFHKSEDLNVDLKCQSYYGLGYCYSRKSDYQKSAYYYSLLIDDFFEHPFVQGIYERITEELARNLIAAQDYEKALKVCLGMFERRPSEAFIPFSIGAILRRGFKKNEEALRYLLKAEEMGYTYSNNFGELMCAYHDLNKPLKALQYVNKYDKLVEIKDHLFYYIKGRSLFGAKKYEAAIESLTLALKYGTDEKEISLWKGECYLGLKEYQLAIDSFLRSKELGQKDANMFLELGHCYANLNKIIDATKTLYYAKRLAKDKKLKESIQKDIDWLKKKGTKKAQFKFLCQLPAE